MSNQSYEEPCHFKAGFQPKCPHCKKTNIKISLSEHLQGPANGQYEVIYCANEECHAFLGAAPVLIQNLYEGIKKSDKIEYPKS
jgi:hypothetical protein